MIKSVLFFLLIIRRCQFPVKCSVSGFQNARVSWRTNRDNRFPFPLFLANGVLGNGWACQGLAVPLYKYDNDTSYYIYTAPCLSFNTNSHGPIFQFLCSFLPRFCSLSPRLLRVSDSLLHSNAIVVSPGPLSLSPLLAFCCL